MKKKSLVMMLVALVLVGAVGVGATLAYLSDATNVMTNTFTVGSGIGITQDEEDVDYDYDKDDDGKVDPEYDEDNDGKVDEDKKERTDEGNDYTDIQPGDVLVKDPTVTITAKSSDCYVFMELKGADALTAQNFAFDGFNNNWTKVAGAEGSVLDGLYQYKEVVVKADADQVLAPLFTSVTYSIDAEELEEGTELSDVTVMSCAVQADNMTAEAALAAAQTVLEDAKKAN